MCWTAHTVLDGRRSACHMSKKSNTVSLCAGSHSIYMLKWSVRAETSSSGLIVNLKKKIKAEVKFFFFFWQNHVKVNFFREVIVSYMCVIGSVLSKEVELLFFKGKIMIKPSCVDCAETVASGIRVSQWEMCCCHLENKKHTAFPADQLNTHLWSF